MASCAPESLQYARLLAESGRHSAAAAYLQQLVTKNPLHRAARRLLVEQLLLDNQISAAKLQARQLREIAANARDYVPIVKDREWRRIAGANALKVSPIAPNSMSPIAAMALSWSANRRKEVFPEARR